MSLKKSKIRDLFNNLQPHESVPTRLVSQETKIENGVTKPLIELQPSGDKLVLKFIRSNKPEEYLLDDLMKGFFCYAKDNKYKSVGLEDDALFSNGDCKFRALTFRALQNKASIYDKYGYKPKSNVSRNIRVLNSFGLIEGLEILQNLRGMSDLYKQAERFGEDATLAEFILSLDCDHMRECLNRLDELAYKYTIKPGDYSGINPDAKRFLTLYREYVKAHEDMISIPVCLRGGSSSSSRKSPSKVSATPDFSSKRRGRLGRRSIKIIKSKSKSKPKPKRRSMGSNRRK